MKLTTGHSVVLRNPNHGKVRKKYCSPNCSWVGEVALRGCFGNIFIPGFVLVFKFVSEPTPLAEKQPHPSVISGCFDAGMTKDWWSFVFDLFFSGKVFIFLDAPNNWKGNWSEKNHFTLDRQSSLCIFCRTPVCPWCFSWGEVLFAALLNTRPSSKGLHLTLHVDALTPVCCHSWASFVLVVPWSAAESTFGDGPGDYWTFLGALKPSSQQLNLSPWRSWPDKWLI